MPQCKQCKSAFEITDADRQYYDRISPVFGGKKYPVLEPTFCPECRQQRRLAFRNDRFLYHRKCDLTGKSIISIISPDKSFKVYNQEDWWSDKWNPADFGREFDFSRPFFDQFAELQKEVPRNALSNKNAINSEYVAIGDSNKNCYMSAPCFRCEDCYYGSSLYDCKNTLNSLLCEKLEIANECVNCTDGYRLFYCQDCTNCRESYFCKECIGCQDCIGCFGLVNKKYCVLNEQKTKGEYEVFRKKLLENLDPPKIDEFRQYLRRIELALPHRHFHQVGSENCEGDYFIQCKNCHESYDLKRCEDCKYCYRVFDARDCYDASKISQNMELSYEVMNVGLNAYHTMFCHVTWGCADTYYSDSCFYSKDLFGCVGLRNQRYCILNKQYSKEDYEKLVPKIIEHMRKTGEWGEFFPIALSPFAYNETTAMEYYPLSKQDIQRLGWKWLENAGTKFYKGEKVKIPANINEVSDDILEKILICELTGQPYKIIPQELKFYRENQLPIPLRCPDQRHLDRHALRLPRKLFGRTCAKCQKAIRTSYSPDRPEIVYCEQCYLKEVY